MTTQLREIAQLCEDLGLADVLVWDDGAVSASLGTRHYLFEWDELRERPILVDTYDDDLPWQIACA